MPAWLKITLKIIAALVLLVLLLIGGATLNITLRKEKFLQLVND